MCNHQNLPFFLHTAAKMLNMNAENLPPSLVRRLIRTNTLAENYGGSLNSIGTIATIVEQWQREVGSNGYD